MTSQGSVFKILDRGFDKTILLLPGWATDYRIFGTMDLDFNYLMPQEPLSSVAEIDLSAALADMKLNKISILGWSMGGFMAHDIASKHPGKIDEIIFIGIKKEYDKMNIEKVKGYIAKNKRAYLDRFYENFFSEYEKEGLAWFKQNLMESYVDGMKPDVLLEGLDYLVANPIKGWGTTGIKVKFIHGKLDRITPIGEARETKGCFPQASFIAVDGAGHAPFLRKDFKKIFYG